jgi:hypothetical protein
MNRSIGPRLSEKQLRKRARVRRGLRAAGGNITEAEALLHESICDHRSVWPNSVLNTAKEHVNSVLLANPVCGQIASDVNNIALLCAERDHSFGYISPRRLAGVHVRKDLIPRAKSKLGNQRRAEQAASLAAVSVRYWVESGHLRTTEVPASEEAPKAAREKWRAPRITEAAMAERATVGPALRPPSHVAIRIDC